MAIDVAPAVGAPAGERQRRRWVSAVLGLLIIPFAVWAGLWLAAWEEELLWVQLLAFTPYVAAASPVVPIVALLLRRWIVAAAGLAVSAVLAAAVLPRALPDGEAPAPGPPLRVMAANLLMGQADADELVALVRAEKVDVLALQEITAEATKRLERAGLGELLPNRAGSLIRPGVGGSALYSRFELRELEAIDIGGFGQARAALWLPGGADVEVTSVHPCAPKVEHRLPCWRDGLRALPRPDAAGPPHVLAGDFNATLDHAEIRDLLAAGYRDAADATGDGLRATWPVIGNRGVPGVTLDRILVNATAEIIAFRVHTLSRTDHRVTFAELRLP